MFQLHESFPQSDSIELTYGEHSKTALRATRTTDQPLAAPVSSISQRGIHYLNQCPILARQTAVHMTRIPQRRAFLLQL